MAENHTARAPYNFIPFAGRPVFPYESPEQLPPHDQWDGSLKTGEIPVKLTAETPVFVSDGDSQSPHFFRGSSGKYMIPGSTLRGVVRENMQILGLGCVRPGEDVQDRRMYFRDFDDPSYKTILGSSNGKIPKNVAAGYLCKEGKTYKIYPAKGPYLRIPRHDPVLRSFGREDARAVEVLYRAGADRVKYLCSPGAPNKGTNLEHGYLLYTGRPAKKNPIYLFPEKDETAQPVLLSEEDVLSYAEDWEARQTVLGKKKFFWKLPEAGESKPVFYLRHEEHTYWGMTLFPRIAYPHALAEGLPRVPQGAFLDRPHAILGFAETQDGQTKAFRSRVSFGDLPAEGAPKEMEEIKLPLSEPKPSYQKGYVQKGKSYHADDFRLRGYKQYWLREPEETQSPAKNEAVLSSLRPFPKGTVFRGVIRYENLTVEELGLLLWSLRLEEGCYQTIGMGKPYGFGRMKLEIGQLLEFSLEGSYLGETLSPDVKPAVRETVDAYISAYDCSDKKGPLRDRAEIQDFFFMKRTIQPSAMASYMDLDAHKEHKRDLLPTVEEIRRQAQKEEKPQSMEEWKKALLEKYQPAVQAQTGKKTGKGKKRKGGSYGG